MTAAERSGAAFLAALLVHAGVAAWLMSMEKPEEEEIVLLDFDLEVPEPEAEPEPEPEAEPEPEPEPEPPPPAPAQAPPAREPPPAIDPGPPAEGDPGDPAPGWAVETPSDQAYQIGDVAVTHARAPRGKGKGGTGGGSGTGGGGQPGATAGGEPAPVSVASIKTMPKPIGDTDFVAAHREYPPDAKRLGIEGQVKVRLVVDAQGRVAKKTLVTRLGHGLDELALQLAGKLQFRPAVDTEDRAVAAAIVWTFTFTLPR